MKRNFVLLFVLLVASLGFSQTGSMPCTGTITCTTPTNCTSTCNTAPQLQSLKIGAIPAVGTVGTAYSASLAATGGVSPFVWSASGLPPGIRLSTGSITSSSLTGTPTLAGVYKVTLGVKDSAGNTGTSSPTITINSTGPPPPITSACSVPGLDPYCGMKSLSQVGTGSF